MIQEQLKKHASEIEKLHLRGLFEQNPNRFNDFHLTFNDFILDYSKNKITDETMRLLMELARQAHLDKMINALSQTHHGLIRIPIGRRHKPSEVRQNQINALFAVRAGQNRLF